MTNQIKYKWASLGTGVIANELAQALEALGGKLYSVANRTYDKGVAFAEKYGIEKVYQEIDEVFKDPEVDIIYISTPHNTHINFLRKALAAGKHVLCEKSITLNSEELAEAIQLAEENHVKLAEAMTIFHMPIYRKLSEIVESGKLGPLKVIQMNFGSYKEYDMTNRFFNRNLAGGALLDIGVYALSFVRWFMTSQPTEMVSQVKLAPTGVDEQAGILLTNAEGEMATVTLSLHAKQPKRGTIAYDKGYIELYEYPVRKFAINVDLCRYFLHRTFPSSVSVSCSVPCGFGRGGRALSPSSPRRGGGLLVAAALPSCAKPPGRPALRRFRRRRLGAGVRRSRHGRRKGRLPARAACVRRQAAALRARRRQYVRRRRHGARRV